MNELQELQVRRDLRDAIQAGDDAAELTARRALKNVLAPSQQDQAGISQAAAQQAYAGLSPVDKFGVGVANSALETWEGAKQLMGLDGPETRQRLELSRATPFDWFSGPGYVAGEIAQLAAPIGLAAKATKLPMAADVVMSGLQGGLKGTLEGESRLTNAAIGAGGAGAAHGLGRLFTGPVRPSPEARALIDQGIPVTPGEAGGAIARMAEQAMEALPIAGSVVKGQQRKALETWNKNVLSSISPGGDITQIGQKGLNQLNDKFNRGYADVLDAAPARVSFDEPGWQQLQQIEREYGQFLGADALKELEGELSALTRESWNEGIPSADLKVRMGQFRKLAQAAHNRGQARLGDAYDEIVEAISGQYSRVLPPDKAAQLKVLDSKYREFVPLVRTMGMKGVVGNDSLFTPSQLLSGLRADDPSLRKKAFALGNTPMQQTAQEAEEVLGRVIPNQGPGTAEKLLQAGGLMGVGAGLVTNPAVTLGVLGAGTAGAGMMPLMRSPMIGQMPGQATARNVMQRLPPMPGVASQSIEPALTPDKPTAANSVGKLITQESVGPLLQKPWFRKWATSPVKPSADNPRSHAVRLKLLAAGEKLTAAERDAVDRLVKTLTNIQSIRGK